MTTLQPIAALIEANNMTTISFTAHVSDALILALAAMLLDKAAKLAIHFWQTRKPVLVATPAA